MYWKIQLKLVESYIEKTVTNKRSPIFFYFQFQNPIPINLYQHATWFRIWKKVILPNKTSLQMEELVAAAFLRQSTTRGLSNYNFFLKTLSSTILFMKFSAFAADRSQLPFVIMLTRRSKSRWMESYPLFFPLIMMTKGYNLLSFPCMKPARHLTSDRVPVL